MVKFLQLSPKCSLSSCWGRDGGSSIQSRSTAYFGVPCVFSAFFNRGPSCLLLCFITLIFLKDPANCVSRCKMLPELDFPDSDIMSAFGVSILWKSPTRMGNGTDFPSRHIRRPTMWDHPVVGDHKFHLFSNTLSARFTHCKGILFLCIFNA